MSIVGFDFGNLVSEIAVTKNKGIEVIMNEVSSRETSSMVSFGAKERFMGEAAKSQAGMNPKNTVNSVKRFLGRNFSEPEVQEDIKLLRYKVESGEHDRILIKVQSGGESGAVFTFEHVTAMVLKKLKEIAEGNLSARVVDCVISVPNYFTDRQRRAMLDAAKVAGLNPLRLANEQAAIALNWGFYKTDLEEGVPRNVMFFDMGESSTTVSIAAFLKEKGGKEKLTVKGVAWDRTLGGRNFDVALVDHFIAEFKEKFKIDVRTNMKALTRVMSECEKMKRVLSTNAEAPINIECLMEDTDVRGKMSREQFERMIGPLVERVLVPVQEALAIAGMTTEDIHVVEIVGNAVRLPAVRDRLQAFVGKTLSNTMNNSEAIARGCALLCAQMSPVIRIRDYGIEDMNMFPVVVSFLKDDGSRESSEIFRPKDVLPVSRAISFTRKASFDVWVDYGASPLLPVGATTHIGKYRINLPATGEERKVKVTVRLDANGIISVVKAVMIEDYEVEVEEVVGETPAAAAKPAEGDPMEEGEEGGDTPMPDAAPAETAAPGTKVKRMKKKQRKTDIAFTEEGTASMSAQELRVMTERENELALNDKVVRETAETKNAVESYIYDMRSRLGQGDDLHPFITDADRTAFSALLDQSELWLEDEGDRANKSTLQERLNRLHSMGDPVVQRLQESTARPAAAIKLREALANLSNLARSTDEKYAHIEQADKDKIVAACDDAEKWLSTKLAAMEQLPKTSPPSVLASEIARKEADVEKLRPLMLKPKPAPPPAPKPEAPKEGTPAAETPKEGTPAPEPQNATPEPQVPPAKDMDLD